MPPLLLLLLLLISAATSATAKKHNNAPRDLIHSSCIHASYPNLCLRTLSSYSGATITRRELAQAAVKVSLEHASKVSSYLNTLSSGLKTRRERVALNDCVEQIAESVDELGQTLAELKHLRGETFRWQLSNAETWVSSALTNEDTCLDGFQEVEIKVKEDMKKKITNVARVTSNALYMINRLGDESRGKPKFSP